MSDFVNLHMQTTRAIVAANKRAECKLNATILYYVNRKYFYFI